jgi:hypothetical protein
MRRLLPLLLLLFLAAPAHAASDQEATFQDDNLLIYTTPAKQKKHLDELAKLGVDRVRATILWRAIAPTKRPSGFDATDPADYPVGVWAKYDALVAEAYARGIRVNFNVTAPSPNWANKKAPRKDIQDNYEPSPKAFGQFVGAVARRYTGDYPDAAYGRIPRVDYWSLYNEPNHSGWLTPTWQKSGGVWFERSASLYRELLDAGYSSLVATGHGKDTILFGETAPAGNDRSRNLKRFMTPLRFVRALYCVDKKEHRLAGKAAKRLGCPASAKAFYDKHPALFKATGFAHHPYQLIQAPTARPGDKNQVTIGVLPRLERTLDTIQRRYGQRKRFPLYLTEFGYQSKPDKLGVSPAKQARFLNQSEYIASRDKRVRTIAQFLLRDDGAPIGLTFQSGIRYHGGRKKPSYAAYRLPIWAKGHRVWGVARPAKANERATVKIQVKRGKTWKTARTVKTSGRHNHFVATVHGTGAVRVLYGAFKSRVARRG